MLKKLGRLFLCHVIGHHEWTTDFIERGNKVSGNFSRSSTVEEVLAAFEADNIMYCKYCRELSSLNKTHKGRIFSRELKD